MEYKNIDKTDNDYIISDWDKGSVSILNSTELIMFTLYQNDNINPLKSFIIQLGVSEEDLPIELNNFINKIKNDGWLRQCLPENSATFFNSIYLNITDACNYRCVYCYQGKGKSYNQSKNFMSYGDFEFIILKIKKINPRCRIILTGGEPFLHKEILNICNFIEKQKMSFSILTNGSLINDNTASALFHYDYLNNVQISIDGMSENIHNLTRGKTYHRTLAGIKTIIKHKVPFSLAPTIHDINLDEIFKIAEYSFHNNGGFTPNNLRIFPHCAKDSFFLSDQNFLKTLYEVENKLIVSFTKEKVIEQKLRTFINKNSNKDHFICGVANDIFDINWNGDIYPCHLLRDEKLIIGNFLSDNIQKIVSKVDELKIRIKTFEIEKCKNCHFMSMCGGGCKAAAYYSDGTFKKEDPICPVLYENELNNLKNQIKAN
jgi:radical SAM protein with 4Fe4S-binding SPASM domain